MGYPRIEGGLQLTHVALNFIEHRAECVAVFSTDNTQFPVAFNTEIPQLVEDEFLAIINRLTRSNDVVTTLNASPATPLAGASPALPSPSEATIPRRRGRRPKGNPGSTATT